MPKILLVEDNDLNREMLARRLARRDFQIVSASNGEQVLKTLGRFTPDLILLDMSLPDLNGWELSRRMKAAPETGSIPIIALTAHALPGDRERALAAGCDDYQTKPIDFNVLLTKMDRLLAHAAPEPPAQSGETLPSAQERSAAQVRLLMVSGSDHGSEIVSRRLHESGYAVTAARTGAEAINYFQRQSYDLIFLDLGPAPDQAATLLRVIRSTHAPARLPIIATAEDRQHGIALLHAGANDFLTRPLDIPVLLARIRTQLAVHVALQHTATHPNASPRRVADPVPLASAVPQAWGGPRTSLSVSQATVLPSKRGPIPATAGDTKHELNSTQRFDLPPTTVLAPVGTLPSQRVGIIPGYEILEELGHGGMGVVFKARHAFMKRLVALKVIDHKHLTNPEAVRRFHQEVQAAAQLSHRNIVMAYDAGQYGETHYFAMEYVEGANLAQIIEKEGPLPVATACDYIIQVSRGLQHAYEKGLVHRDIKPSNLFVSRAEGRPTIKILDMGLALLYEPVEPSAAAGLTRDGRVVGTADYMAPEQWMNAHKVDIRADLYSLGCTFYFLLTGQVPFPTDEVMEKMLKHHLEEPIPIRELRPEVPPKVVAVIGRLMAKRPEARYPKPAEVAAALNQPLVVAESNEVADDVERSLARPEPNDCRL